MKSKLLVLITFASVLGVSQAVASPITYNVSDSAGVLSFTGTITTDGNAGILASGDISNWSITINGFTTVYTLTPSNSSVHFDGVSELSATATTLSWLWSNGIGNITSDFKIELLNLPARAFFLYEQSSSIDVGVLALDAQSATGGSDTIRDLGETADTFGAAVSTTPLPATLPLFAAGLGALGLFGWRRKRQAAALTAA